MATFKYIIRKNKSAINKDGSSLLFLRYTHKGVTAYFTTKKSITISDWDHESQRVRKSYRGYSTLNMYLSKFKQNIEDIVNKALFEDIEPTTVYVRKTYQYKNSVDGKKQKQRKALSFIQFSKEFIEESKKIKTKSTIRSYTDFLSILDI